MKVIDNFYLIDQNQQVLEQFPDANAQDPKKDQLTMPNYSSLSQSLPPSLIDTCPEFQKRLKQIYTQNLQEINNLLNDSRIYMEQHFLESQGEMNYHNWFLYE